MTQLRDVLVPLALPGLPEGVRAWYTRRGPEAVPGDPYSGFSLCGYTGDSPAHVAECRAMLCRGLGVPPSDLVMPRQTHSAEVAVVGEGPRSGLCGVDALVTDRPGIVIGVSTADCVPVVLADPAGRRIGVAHAGWRGALGGVVEHTLEAMVGAGSRPEDVVAAFGPSICQKCFEVGEEVALQFPPEFVDRSGSKPHVSLQGFIASRLRAYGVADSNIARFSPGLCTMCHPMEFFSARVSGVSSGRVALLACLDAV